MCGRFGSCFLPRDIWRMFHLRTEPEDEPAWLPSWNLCPMQEAPVVLGAVHDGAPRRVELLRWGFVPRWAKDPKETRRPINARAEAVAKSGVFRDAFARRRCLVPAGVFYEWQRTPGQRQKQPYAIARADGQPTALAGLWEVWRAPDDTRQLRTFTIVTTNANEDIMFLHRRMPVIIEEVDWGVWLGEEPGSARDLLRPSPNGMLHSWPISTRVNSPANNGAELLRPLALVGTGL